MARLSTEVMPHCTTLQVEHKIQSSDGPLQLQLAMVTQPEHILVAKLHCCFILNDGVSIT